MSYFTEVKRWDDATGVDRRPRALELRRECMEEEWGELQDAIEADDVVEIADACADLIWTVLGFANVKGLPFDAIWAEVRRSNMDKILPDGSVLRNERGKIVKPPGWTPPDIAAALALEDV